VRVSRLLSALILTALPSAAANVEVHVNAGRVDLKLPGAALSEVLERLSKALDFKLVREESVPDPFLPALEFKGRTPVEAVLGVLDGLGLNYAITMDASGSGIESLILTAAKPSTPGTAPTARPTPFAGGPGFIRPPHMPPAQPDDSDDVNVSEPPEMVAPDQEPPAAPPVPLPSPPSTAPPPPGPRPIQLPQPYAP
jgi:hypothetical protein